MAEYTVVTVVNNGHLEVVGILTGAYGVQQAMNLDGEEIPLTEAPDMAAHVITADNRADAERIVRERYYPKGGDSGDGEVPC